MDLYLSLRDEFSYLLVNERLLKKEPYGLKQAPRSWYSSIDSYLTHNGFQGSESEPMLFIKVNEQDNMLIVYLYVDDLIFTSDSIINNFRSVMESDFEMTDLGKVFSRH